jgi:hypothetical protein
MENAFALGDSPNNIREIECSDLNTSRNLMNHSISEFPAIFDGMRLKFKFEWTDIFESISVHDAREKGTIINLIAWPDLRKWKNTYSFAEYCDEMTRTLCLKKLDDFEFKTFKDDYSNQHIEINIRSSSPYSPIIDDIVRWEKIIRECHMTCVDSLSARYRRKSLPGDKIADIDLDEENDEFALDPGKPLVLLLGNIGHEGVLSSLSAARRQYKRKMLDSSPANWEAIIEYFSSFKVTAVLVKLMPHTLRLLSLEEYQTVRNKLFSLVAAVPNIVFVYEDLLTGKEQQDEYQKPYPQSDELTSVISWFNLIGIELTPYKKNAEVTVLSESFLIDTEKHLIFRLYIPNGRIWSNEADRFLQLFRDYLGRVNHLTTRLDQRRTDHGIIYEFHGDAAPGETGLHSEFEEFSKFMDLCASNSNAAEALLTTKNINHKEIIDIVSRYSKEAKRLQVDLKHEKERKYLSIRQRLESELVDSVLTTTDWRSIESFINAAIPYSGEMGSLLSLTHSPSNYIATDGNLTVNVRPQIFQTVNGIVAQEIYGNQHLSQSDQQILSLIKAHGGTKTKELESAVHELADDSAPKTDRLSAKQKLKTFLIAAGKRTADVAVGVLQTYIENKLGFKS